MNDLLSVRSVISSHLLRRCLGRVMPGKLPLLLAIGATVVASALSACGYSAREAQFEIDATTHGVRRSTLDQWPYLGMEVCAALKGGQTPMSWATYMASPPDAIPMEQGLAIIYWAVKDVCPDQMYKGLDDAWKDAIYNQPATADTEPSALPSRTEVGPADRVGNPRAYAHLSLPTGVRLGHLPHKWPNPASVWRRRRHLECSDAADVFQRPR
jgi:hypothetical protein